MKHIDMDGKMSDSEQLMWLLLWVKSASGSKRKREREAGRGGGRRLVSAK
jgi:hypothetical protein